jgi:GT2 family glycosyltransferase
MPDLESAPTFDVAISIGSLGNYDALQNCLASLYAEDSPAVTYEIWVVYNGPGGDGACDKIRKYFPTTRVIERRGPIGFCAAHNLALKEISSRYVLVLDDDTIVPRGTLPHMVAFMDREPQVGVAGCRTHDAVGRHEPTSFYYPGLLTELAGIVRAASIVPRAHRSSTELPIEVDWLSGCFLFSRIQAIRAIGGFDERFYTYISEADWCHRIRLAGWRVMYLPEVTIVHLGGAHSTNTRRTTHKTYARIVHYHVNRFYFIRKHRSRLVAFAIRPVIALQSLTRILFFAVNAPLRPGLRPIAATRIRAFWRVFRLCFSSRPHQLPSDIAPG